MRSLLRYVVALATCSIVLGQTEANGSTGRISGSSYGIPGLNKTFDYIVVGGGTAGLTMAARLAENPQLSVAVIEAGGFYEQNNGNVSQVPAFAPQYSSASPSSIQPAVDWGFITVPQPQLNGREIHYTQGKCLGGGSGRNYLIYQRGTVGSYQRWADLVGDSSYTFDKLLPLFQKSIHFSPPDYAKRGPNSTVKYDPTAFKSGGPLQVSYLNYFMPFSPYIKKALNAMGMSEIAGSNSGKLLGCTEITATLDPKLGTRSSSETSFLQQSMAKSTIQVYQSTLANRILFSGKKATGVEVTTAGLTYHLAAAKEVIVSAGVFKSPQLLMVSGIGPAATLKELNIPVVSDLQGVGQNIIDHPFFDTTFKVSVPTQTRLTADPAFLASATKEYLSQQKGPLAASVGNYIGWEKLPKEHRSKLSQGTLHDLATYPGDWPELQYVPVPGAVSVVNGSLSDNYMSMSVMLCTPTSRGNITLKSASTLDHPGVNPAWLSTKTDQEMAVAGLKRARQIANATGLIVGSEVMPGLAIQSDQDILDYIRSEVRPIHHAVSSCAMGKRGDPKTVVDSNGRVMGVAGLRVVDTSVFPLLPPGQIQGTVYALAEKIATDILGGA